MPIGRRRSTPTELTRWLAVTTTPGAPSGPVLSVHLGQGQREKEPLLLPHMSDSPPAARHVRLIFGATYVAVGSASREWFERGGDLATYVEESLDAFGEGLSDLS